jgi:Fe-S-cluster containining protein
VTATCRPGCAACCIAPSISPVAPALPDGKPAGVPCPHLDAELRCVLFGRPERPPVCVGLQPQPAMCGADRAEAMATIIEWERLTAPRGCR